ncbi:hypothetical protein [Halorientalis litorea]|uniref:hypothetical protein n=1 Tax=Halorientalis litorea TaxID=2931977 RepID=UPI001FF4D397|nr:hypothetical protein [Halorientalis litorea]
MRDGTPSTEGTHLTRRGLLAVAGASVLGGCSSLDGLASDSESTIRAYDLPDVDADSIPEPVVAPSVPVDIHPGYFASTRDRVTSLLAELPTPLGPDDVPNGHVRQRLTDAAAAATEGLDEARTARTGLVALQSLRDAREHARYAAAGWAVADRGLSVDPLQREHGRAVTDARSVRNDHEYVGTDPVAAALVHARIEDALEWVTDNDRPHTHNEGELLTVAEWGETAELARAYVADARHLDDRLTASLPDDAGTVEGVLTRAAESLFADIRSRRAALPPEPTAEDWGLVERTVHELRRQVDDPRQAGDAPGPASAVVDATDRLAKFRAFDRVRERVDAGEITSAESAEAVREARTTAYDALDTALEESPDSGLARTVVSDASWRVSHADRELSRFRGDISHGRLDSVLEDYIVATAVARATPAACQQTVDALETA